MVKRERIAYIDIAKAICIILMVVGHWTTNSTLLMYIYSFHMPALFVISGYLYKPHSWKRTLLSFGVPVAFCSLVNLAALILTGELTINSVISKEIFYRFFHYRYGLGEGFYMGDWFIWALLGLRLLFGDIKCLSILRKYYVLILLIVIVYMTFEYYLINVDKLCRGWYIGRLIPSLPFFCFGFFIKDRKWNPQCLSIYHVLFFAFIFAILPLINGACSINSNEYGMSYLIFLVNAIVSTLFIFAISVNIPQNQLATIISKGTLLILGLHVPLMRALDFFLPYYCDYIIPFIAILLCYYPIKLLDEWCPILLGRINK